MPGTDAPRAHVQPCGLVTSASHWRHEAPLPWPRVRSGARGTGGARKGGIIHALCRCCTCSCCLLLAAGAHAADVKGTSRIDARHRLSLGRRADAHRQGQARARRARHCCSPTCPRAPFRSSIRVEGKATGKLEIGSVDTPPRVRAAHRRCGRRHRAQARRGCHREAEGRARRPAGGRAGGRGAEDADRQPGAAADQARAGQRRGAAAARLGAALRPDRPARRRGAEDHPRHAGQDPRGRPADQGPGRQARLAGAGAGGAHRGQGLRQRRRRRSRPTSPSATRSAPRRGCRSTMRASPPAPRRRRRSCSSCAAPASSSAAARAGTTSRWRCRRRGPAPAPPRRSSAR